MIHLYGITQRHTAPGRWHPARVATDTVVIESTHPSPESAAQAAGLVYNPLLPGGGLPEGYSISRCERYTKEEFNRGMEESGDFHQD